MKKKTDFKELEQPFKTQKAGEKEYPEFEELKKAVQEFDNVLNWYGSKLPHDWFDYGQKRWLRIKYDIPNIKVELAQAEQRGRAEGRLEREDEMRETNKKLVKDWDDMKNKYLNSLKSNELVRIEERERILEAIRQDLLDLDKGKIRWDCQCPPERRGAEIALVHLLGKKWEDANKITKEFTSRKEAIELIVFLREDPSPLGEGMNRSLE